MNIAERQKPPPGELFLDHVSHFVPSLEAAAEALEALGFVVTPLSVQRTPEGPVGASNRCVMLQEGYLEFLTPTHATPAAARMRAAMARHGGVHLACFGTPHAEREERRLLDHGFAPQPMVRLEREVEDGNVVRFHVVRPSPERMPEGRIQFVQQMTPEHIWRPGHLGHRNEVLALAGLYVVADDPLEAGARWARFAALLPRDDEGMVRLDATRGWVRIGTHEQLSRLLGPVPAAPALAGYALRCTDAAAFAARCERAGFCPQRREGLYGVRLPEALGAAWTFS
jgi:hypothetical protein